MSSLIPKDVLELLSPGYGSSEQKLARAVKRYTNKLLRCLEYMNDDNFTPVVLPHEKPKRKLSIEEGLTGVERNPGPDKKKSKVTNVTTTVIKKVTPPNTNNKPKKGKKTGNSGKRNPYNGLSPVAKLYLKSLLQPFSGPARIPDACSFATTLINSTADTSFTINSNGCGGIRMLLFNGAASNNYFRESATSTDDIFDYTGGGPNTFPANPTILPNFTITRLVSGGIIAETTASTTVDQGVIYASNSFNGFSISETPPTSTDLMLSRRDNRRVRVRDGISITYKPIDNSSDEFSTAGSTEQRAALQIHVSGAAVGSKFMVRMVANYEAVPGSDILAFSESSPSPQDSTGHGKVRSMLPSFSSFATVAGMGLGMFALKTNLNRNGQRFDWDAPD